MKLLYAMTLLLICGSVSQPFLSCGTLEISENIGGINEKTYQFVVDKLIHYKMFNKHLTFDDFIV